MPYHQDSPWVTLRSRPQTWKFCNKLLVKVFISLYLLNMSMDQVDTLQFDRYWSQVLCCTIINFYYPPLLPGGQGHRPGNFVFKFWLNICLYVLNMYLYQVDTLHVYRILVLSFMLYHHDRPE